MRFVKVGVPNKNMFGEREFLKYTFLEIIVLFFSFHDSRHTSLLVIF